MKIQGSSVIVAGALLSMGTLQALATDVLHSKCTIGVSEKPGEFRLSIEREDCTREDHCGEFSNSSFSRFSGISAGDLGRDGAQLTARIESEAGTFTCAGVVHGGELKGKATFSPNAQFVARMGQMGFSGLTGEKLQAYTLFDITTAWVQSLKDAKIDGLSTDNLIAMRIFQIDAAYANGFTALGYEMPRADKLIAMKVQKVNADEVREIRSLGFQPTLDELVQIRIFKITPDFIRQVRGRGFENLTISKLVQMKIFKLDE